MTTVEKIMDIIEEHCEIVTQKQYDELYVAIESIILSDCGTCPSGSDNTNFKL